MKIFTRDLVFRFGELPVLDKISMAPEEGRITCILGPSGCGKTTLLNIFSGVLTPNSGEVSGVNAGEAAYLFQEPRLLPWKTIRGNLELVLKGHYESGDRKIIIDRILEEVALSEFSGYYPSLLSGGMRQRAALARAFVYPSNILFMDEPFQAVDPVLKLNLMDVFQRLWLKEPKTCLLVTHNIQEAAMLGDEILVFSKRPSRIVNRFTNNISHEGRVPYSDEILHLEHELYTALISNENH